ncbi:glycosyl transferase family 1 [Novosphingobium sp.]|uniref:glycosyl transferase family 1 n=1 Tax=Novosphingobium sp. TaxID=1874826 RepID=UPI003D0B9AD5
MLAADAPPIRVLFVFAWLGVGCEEREVRLLAQALDPARYRLEAVVCFHKQGTPDTMHARLQAAGVPVDRTPHTLGFDETVAYLASKLPAYDVIVSYQNVADVYPALELMHLRPPLIDRGFLVSEAIGSPKHFTARYVGATAAIRDAAAARMPGRDHDAIMIPAIVETQPESGMAAVASRWDAVFAKVLADRPALACPTGLFKSFLQGGFESSTHRRAHDRKRLDVIAASHHDTFAAHDYAELAALGILTVRDGLRWHLIEAEPGQYDWSSLDRQREAADAIGTEVIWDLLHYGWPDDIDIWTPAFVTRFAAFAAAAARHIGPARPGERRFYAPINEISFFSWGGGDVAYLNPFARGRGYELKVQLARAAIAAMEAILAVDPAARFVHADPVINVVTDPSRPQDAPGAEGHRLAQYQAWDMIGGKAWPQIGGRPELLDIVGVNFYHNNQWIHGGAPLAFDHPLSRPLHAVLADVYARYGRPIFIAETGIEGSARPAWLRMILREVQRAQALGVPIEGICLYPILDHPGWDDDRYCPNGLLACSKEAGERVAYPALAEVIRAFRPRTT